MIETTALDIAHCPRCERRVIVAQALDDHDALISVCAHCDTPLHDAPAPVGGYALRALGYNVEGEGPDTEGCGSGGCGSCGA